MKLWNKGVRIFKGLNNCKVYHFGSITKGGTKITQQSKRNQEAKVVKSFTKMGY